MEFLVGTVERIVFNNTENGYTVARFSARGRHDLVTVVGNMADVQAGAYLKVWGAWKNHPTYGEQFLIERYQQERPATIEGIKKYLGSGLIKGVGPVTASRITEHFGLYTLDVIEKEITRLAEVSGVGQKRVKIIARAWEEQKSIKEIMLFLQSHNVSTRLAVKIYKTYKDEAIKVVEDDPYRLAKDIYGIGFITADSIARNMGIKADAPTRIQAGLEYTLNTLADEGHVYVPRLHLVDQAAKLLDVLPEQADLEINTLAIQERVWVETNQIENQDKSIDDPQKVYLSPFYWAEVGVARRLLNLLTEAKQDALANFKTIDWDKAKAYIKQKAGLDLAPQQLEAVKTGLTQRLSLLTGGPGTGKTTTVRAVLRLLQAKGKRVLLAAPTGRAAKRLSETTGHEAKTIHRLLEVDPSQGFRFQRDQKNPLQADMLIVDEVSMIDLILMNNLLKAVGPNCYLLLVGDPDQLPSVGAGNVLKDMLLSKVIPTTRLEVIFRQAQDSTIITNAHRVNQGQTPLYPKNKNDFYLFSKADSDPDGVAELIVDIIANRIPNKFGVDPLHDVQLLCPMHRGSVGVGNLNRLLQAKLTPQQAQVPQYQAGSRLYRVGDKVLQLRNNYDKDVFNGDIGFIQAIDLEEGAAILVFDNRQIVYEFSDLDEITLAYAMSVHKSQGSEYPIVVLPLVMQHWMMLQRNLLYTAITRAKKAVILVSSGPKLKAIAMAVKNNKVDKRWSDLANRLKAT